jgi:hypothetical protein
MAPREELCAPLLEATDAAEQRDATGGWFSWELVATQSYSLGNASRHNGDVELRDNEGSFRFSWKKVPPAAAVCVACTVYRER